VDVRTTDEVGNVGSPDSFGWTVDTTAPDVQIDIDMPAATSSAAASFSFSSTDSGAVFQCRIDGGAWQACTSPKAYGGLDEGSHSFDVRSRDEAGNTSSPASDTWTVADSGPPNTFITSAPSATTASTDADFEYGASEQSNFQCKLDDGAFGACGSGSTGSKSYASLADGPHTFTVRATDMDGNADATPATSTWEIIVPPAPPTGGGTAGVSAKSPVITPGKGPLKRGKGTAATITCPTGPCNVNGKKAKVKIAGVSYAARVKVLTTLAAGSTTQVKVTLPKAAKAALAGAGSGKLTLKLTVGSPAGTVNAKVKLKVKP
jgi:hypothetical protein